MACFTITIMMILILSGGHFNYYSKGSHLNVVSGMEVSTDSPSPKQRLRKQPKHTTSRGTSSTSGKESDNSFSVWNNWVYGDNQEEEKGGETEGEELPISTSSVGPALLFTLPESLIGRIWESHGYKEARNLPLISKSISGVIKRASPVRFRFHLMYPVPSILACLDRFDEECLAYWRNRQLTLSRNQFFTILVALFSETNGISKQNPRLSGEVQNAFYCKANTTMKAALSYLKIQWFMRSQVLRLHNLPSSQVAMSPSRAAHIRSTYRPIMDAYMDFQASALAFWRRSTDTSAGEKEKEALTVQRQQFRQVEDWHREGIENTRVPHGTLLEITTDFHLFLLKNAATERSAYESYVGHISARMSTIRDLDSFNEGHLVGPYPTLSFPSRDVSLCRIIHHQLFPRLSMILARRAINRRRLDILTTLIRDEGLMSVARRVATTFPSKQVRRLIRMPMNQDNILFVLMMDIRHPRVGDVSHPSWGTSPLPVIRLLLENGGLALVYPHFLTHAVKMGDVELMRYLVLELKIQEGLSRALNTIRRQNRQRPFGSGASFELIEDVLHQAMASS